MQIRGMMDSGIVVSPKWVKVKDKVSLRQDFERLLKLDFAKLIGAQGALVPRRAKEEVVLDVERAFPVLIK